MAPQRIARRPRVTHETRVLLFSLAGGAPALAVALTLIWSHPHATGNRLLATVGLTAVWIAFGFVTRDLVRRPLQTLSNMIAALHERDYSIRARGARTDSALGLAFLEVNALAEMMRRQRLDAIEATALVREMMEAIDVAVFAFDPDQKLTLINRGGESLVGLTAERAVGTSATQLGLADALAGETPRLIDLAIPGRPRRWELRRGGYRWEGRPHELVVLSDLTQSLREEERQAWQRLVRVLSHEINNSLAPIKSIAGSLKTTLGRASDPAARGELTEGLDVIESRSAALSRFIQAYARLARLPKPSLERVPVAAWIRRVAALETRVPITIAPGPEAVLSADPDQLDALLINLVRNAADAALETRGAVRIGWSAGAAELTVRIEDDGPGLSDTGNLFIPFFTTKPGGSGIGLALCRQIAEAHGGTVTLENREGASGCVATVTLPAG